MNVKRFILVGSEAALQDTQPLWTSMRLPHIQEPNSYRGKAKRPTEPEILDFRSAVRRIILRPPYVWGKGNKSIEKVIAKVKSGRFR
jgi:nucleoside-diphosphate-sugar epimerase